VKLRISPESRDELEAVDLRVGPRTTLAFVPVKMAGYRLHAWGRYSGSPTVWSVESRAQLVEGGIQWGMSEVWGVHVEPASYGRYFIGVSLYLGPPEWLEVIGLSEMQW